MRYGQIDWQGFYLDGRTAARHPATIRLMQRGLEVSTDHGLTLWWPYAEIRQTQGFYAGEQVRLERGGEMPEALVVGDSAFLTSLAQVAREQAHHFHNPARRRGRTALTCVAALVVIALTVTLYLEGIPALAAFTANWVPVAWEERLGSAIVAHLAPPEKRCVDSSGMHAIDRLLATLIAPLPKSPYVFRVMVVNDPLVNALAAPGGSIVLFRGLLERIKTPEELAGVLAHELQHILKRHGTRALLQHASISLLFAVLSGDPSIATSSGLEGARLLGLLRYSRQHEEAADEEGVRMLLAAGIDPRGMIMFLQGILEESRDVPAFLTYVSTHPRTADRIDTLKSHVSPSRPSPGTLLQEDDWRRLRRICQVVGR